jgi:hypothetical protein
MVETTTTQTTSEIEARIEKINLAAQRLEEAEKKLAERENSLKELEAVKRLGGITSGAPQEVAPKVETPQEYRDRILRGGI